MSNYSEKDLASIVGPDLVKSRKNDDMDYSSNQVNKGSSTEYFKNKDKLKNNQVSTHEMSHDESDTISPSTKEGIYYNMKRTKKSIKLIEYNECTSEDAHSPCFSGGTRIEINESSSSNPHENSILEVPSKKRKKKTNSENVCNDSSLYRTNECIENDSCSVLEVPCKKRKKKATSKSVGHENSLYSKDESIENDSYSITKPDLPLEVVSSKKTENKLNMKGLQSSLDTKPLTKVKTRKKIKSKNCSELNSSKINIDKHGEKINSEIKKNNSKCKFPPSLSTDVLLNDGIVSNRKNCDNDDLLKIPYHEKEFLETQAPSEITKVFKKSTPFAYESGVKKESDSRSLEKTKKVYLNIQEKKNKTKLSSDLVQGESNVLISPSVENVIGNPGPNSCVVVISAEKGLKKKLKNKTKIESFEDTQVTKEEVNDSNNYCNNSSVIQSANQVKQKKKKYDV